ncbi:MAG: hypothetical protein WBV94_21720 [Blastocatellia bacterium]
MIKGLIEGRIVHFVLPDGPRIGEHRPAIITKVWNADPGTVNLQVFMDGLRDNGGTTRWFSSVLPDEENKREGTWHFPERVE